MAIFWGIQLVVFMLVAAAGGLRLLYRKWIDGAILLGVGLFGVVISFVTLAFMYLYDY